MKINYLLSYCIIVVLASCSSAYRIGQTPDDVYYSPPKPQAVYVTTINQQDKDGYGYNNPGNNEDVPEAGAYNSYYDPFYGNSNFSLSFGSVYNPYNCYGSSFYNPYSFYSPFNSSLTFSPFNNNYNSFYSSYYGNYIPVYYGSYYYPYNNYYTPVYFTSKPTNTGIYRGPRQYNLVAYNNNRVPQQTNTSSVPVRTFQPQQQQPTTTGLGGFIRRIFTTSDNTNNPRSYNNSSPVREMNSSPGSSGGGGSAPVRTFRH